MITRRQVIAATGVVAGASMVPLSKIVDAQRPPRSDEAVLDHVGREFARLYKIAKTGAVRSEHLQSAAANFRLMAVTFPNDLVKAAAARGDSVQPQDHALHARQVQEVRRRFGLDISNEAMPVPAGDRRATLARLSREGLAPTLLQIAASLEDRAAQIARREGAATPFQLAQFNPYCSYLSASNAAMDIMCAAAFWLGPQGAVSCAVATVSFWSYYYLCN